MIYFIIILTIVTRFIPHMPNFAPITALAIFSAANLGWKKSVGLTLAVRLISDIFLGFFAWPLMLAVYASHLVGVLFGLWIKKTTSLSLGSTRDISPHLFGFAQGDPESDRMGQEGRAPQFPSPSEERGRGEVEIKMLLQVHDELVFEVAEDKVEYWAKKLIPLMENAITLSVPVQVEAKVGDNWGEMKELNKN